MPSFRNTRPRDSLYPYYLRIIRPLPFTFPVLVAVFLGVAGLTACGRNSVGVGDDARTIVVQVGDQSITKSALSHWMSVLIDSDYRNIVGRPAPSRLVADPPNYPACISALESGLGTLPGHGKAPARTHVQLELNCRQLQQSLKRQTLSYLIQGLWDLEEDAKQRSIVTDRDVARVFAREKLKSMREPGATPFTTFIARKTLARSDVLYFIRRTLLSAQLDELRKRRLARTIRGAEALQRALVSLYAETVRKWRARTLCRRGYTVPECRSYRAPATIVPSPAVLLEQLTAR
jgi:hypothetical protein